MGESEERIFLRDATGLVREAGWTDILTFASLNMSWGLSAMWLILWGPWYGPGGSLILGTLLVVIPMIFGSLVWAFMATIMPRSGGDFIFNSRALHPLLGFISSLGWVSVNFIWCAVLAAYIPEQGIAPLLYIAGYESAAEWILSSGGVFIIGAIIIIASAALLLLGMKPYLWGQKILFGFGILMFILIFGIFAVNNNADFVVAWNAVAGAGNYEAISAEAPGYMASEYGYTSLAFSFPMTLALIPVAFWGLGYPYFAAYVAGETKRVERSALIGIPGGLILCGLSWIILIPLVQKVVNYDFLTYTAFAYGDGLSSYTLPFAPMFHVFGILLTPNSLIRFLIGWGYICWLLIYPLYSILGQTRIALAWAFDRQAPSFFGDVSEKWHTPVKSTIFFTAGGIILLALYSFVIHDMLAGFSAMVPQIITVFMITAIAAIVIPYRKRTKALYEASPASKYKIGSIPFITICGVIYFGILAVCLYYYFSNPWLGAWDPNDPIKMTAFYTVVAVFIFGIIYYFINRAYWRRKGIDIELAAKELPPE